MKAIVLTLMLTACTPHVVNPAPTPVAKGPIPSDDVMMVFAEEVITRVSTSGCVGYYYGNIRVRVSNVGEVTGVCL